MASKSKQRLWCVVAAFLDQETRTHVTGKSKAEARRAVGGRILRIEEVTDPDKLKAWGLA